MWSIKCDDKDTISLSGDITNGELLGLIGLATECLIRDASENGYLKNTIEEIDGTVKIVTIKTLLDMEGAENDEELN